jgi:hypothetical protein
MVLWSANVAFVLLTSVTQARILADVIQTDASCYKSSESIRVEYVTRMPSVQNWIGLVDATTNRTLQSRWACGSQDEDCPDRRLVTFHDLENVEPGNYVMELKSYGYHGRMLELRSELFEVTRLGSCNVKDAVKVVAPAGSSTHFTSNSTLEVQFTHSDPHETDAIGIFSTATMNVSSTPPLLWAWTCNGIGQPVSGCELPSNRTMHFSLDTLPTGEYLAILGTFLSSHQRIRPIKSSEPFFVVDTRVYASYRRLEELPCSEVTVKTSKASYGNDEDIPISIHRHGCHDDANEKVAIYDADIDLSFFHATRLAPPPPLMWFCQSEECPENRMEWPLPSAFYKAVLVRILEGKHFYFESEKFLVAFAAFIEPIGTRRPGLRRSKELSSTLAG